ncbi:AraC family transcriptional regulator [Actinoplanes sp. NPDC049596]|uniref:AraC family transcriptional regulator n=1 Tax=unclassified Actinoplanes TaxID=2626549 RepID=UPI00341DC62D
MDSLSALIRMARAEGRVDVRCLLAGRHTLDNPPSTAGKAPFHLLLDGHCTVEAGDRVIDLRAGDLLVLPRGERHRVRVSADGPPAPATRSAGGVVETLRSDGVPAVDLFCGHYTYRPGAGELLFAGLPAVVHASFGTGAASPLRPLGELMRHEAALDGPGSGALLAALCEALLTLALRGDGHDRPHPAPWTAVPDPGLRAVVEAVVSRPGQPWTTAGLARVAGVSRATLARHFAAATGLSIAAFVTRTRMTIAADLLATTELGLDDVAARAGYRSTSAFGKAFRAATGVTPARLRRSRTR